MLILLVLLLASEASVPAAPHLRGASAREKALIDELLARSATARTLAAEIESRDVIVYVQMTRTLARGRAVTGFVTAAGGTRYIRITLGAVPNRDDLAALLAHELQHAGEIARSPNVKDDAGVRRLYQAIGEERGAGDAFETAAARDVGARVRTELSRARPTSGSDPASLVRPLAVPAPAASYK
jgi:hypothetical protein